MPDRRIAVEQASATSRAVRRLDAQSAGGHSVLAVDGWRAGIAWIETWARADDWILLDRSAHPDVYRGLAREARQLLWYESVDAEDVLAMLAELCGRGEAGKILVVREIADRDGLGSREIAALRALCRYYRAALLVVIQTR